MRFKKTVLSTAIALCLNATTLTTAQAAPAAPFPEYSAQWGLGAIGTLYPWGAGATGAGVTVAVIDSGVRASHVDLVGQIAPGGIDFVNNDNDPFDDSQRGHGTFIAGIIAAARNGTGIAGVAYNAKILPIKVLRADQTGRFQDVAAGIDYATASAARVMNLSLINRSDTLVAAALLRAAQADKVIVMAAGNNGSSSPEYYAAYAPQLGGLAIAVGAIKPDGTIASFSNRAGGLMNYYLVAPGVSIASTGNSGDGAFRTDTGGTSWAAPHVAGAAALLLGAFPNLTGAQAVEILLTTATDLGAPGVDPVYGSGLVNIQAALAPAGDLKLPSGYGGSSGGSGGSSSSSSSSMGGGALLLGGALGYALLNKGKIAGQEKGGDGAGGAEEQHQPPGEQEKLGPPLAQVLIVDRYDRGYTVDLASLIRIRNEKPDLNNLLESFRWNSGQLDMALSKKHNLSVLYSVPDVRSAYTEDVFTAADQNGWETAPVWAMSLRGTLGDTKAFSYEMNVNTNAKRDYGIALPNTGIRGASFVSQNAFTSPYLGFAETANSVNFGYAPDDKSQLKLGLVSTDENTRYGLRSSAAIFQTTHQFNDKTVINLQLGQLNEYGSLLGGASNGPLSIKYATTTSLGVSGRMRLSRRMSLIGSYTEGYTRVADKKDSIIREFSGIHSRSFGLGLVGSALFNVHDEFGLAASQPLLVTSGSALLDLPYARDLAGNIFRRQSTIGLAPDGAERDIEVFYKIRVNKNSDLGAYLLYQEQPYHSTELDSRVTLYTTYRLKF